MVHDHGTENVLVLQGGGLLGAFGCGVFKAFAEKNIKIDIIAGTSIGGVNAAIIAGSKNRSPEVALEEFWLELAENSVRLAPAWLSVVDNDESESYYGQYYQKANVSLRNAFTFFSSAAYGNSVMYLPRWSPAYAVNDTHYFRPNTWTHIYDHKPLASTLEKYIDYDKLRPGGKANARLIITAVNVLTAQPLTFDSMRQPITPNHLLGTSGYPLYAFPWIGVDEGLYAWDGSLLSNTPLGEVIDASPITDKQVFIVENYPKKIERLPQSLPEVFHRARDIMFSDKTAHNIKMSRTITRYIQFIEDLYEIVENNIDSRKLDKQKLDDIHRKYQKMMKEHGSGIRKIAYITRDEQCPYLYENTDFSPEGIRNLISAGESKTREILQDEGF